MSVIAKVSRKKTESQSDKILAWLQSGNTLTQLDALRMFRCMRLASRISDLRNAGCNIITQFEKHDGGQHARYSLAGEGK